MVKAGGKKGEYGLWGRRRRSGVSVYTLEKRGRSFPRNTPGANGKKFIGHLPD